jgi:putative acetyltransferase
VTIRTETPEDADAIHGVTREAFGREAEARLVDALRVGPAFVPELSLVAVEGLEVVGHVLFTHLTVRDGSVSHPALALAPVSVRPGWQNLGIGSALVRQGLADARELGHRVVIVLGHPRYYPRFGFQPAQPLGILSPFDAAPEAFLVLGLQPGALEGVRGRVEYPPEFLEVEG